MNLTILEEETESKKMKSEISKRTTFFDEHPVKPRTLRVKIAESSNKLANPGFGHGKNHSASLGKKPILDDDDDEEEKELETQIAEKSYPPKLKWKIQSASVKKNQIAGKSYLPTLLDKEEEELEKMGSKRRNLDSESRTPKTQIAGKSRIGYSIDGKKLPKPKFGYSIDGKKLPRLPKFEKIRDIIRDCSKPFEKKLLKTDVDKIGLNTSDVKKGILPYLNKDETVILRKEGILVKTYDEFGNCYDMKFESYCNCFYKLCNGWKNLFEDHKLNENEDCYVAVWMFRNAYTGELCFAVILKR
ncbi:uncharacterized protein LOC129871136 [Solanum dulcamara]|uniref:uncharacterized protein LOC129871136 n=1 Tax=Solanum dulcamara TaxID=45834 RepID=UPI002486A877|nr:uncharacterized protein LOC129871136 [Solanum dulcamara]